MDPRRSAPPRPERHPHRTSHPPAQTPCSPAITATNNRLHQMNSRPLFYLPLAGPSAVFAVRRLAAWLEESPEGITVPLGGFARELGLGTGNGRNAPVPRVLSRLVVFGLAGIQGDSYAVRLAVPPLARRHLRRLPPHLVLAHELVAEEGAAVERVVPTGSRRE